MPVAWGSIHELLSNTVTNFIAPEGYEFAGWIINGINYAVGDEITVTGNVIVTAQWTPIDHALEVYLRFPGMTNVRVEYWVPGTGWINVPGGPFANYARFEIPEGHEGFTQVRVSSLYTTRANVYLMLRDSLEYSDGLYEYDVPVIPIRVTGLNTPKMVELAIVQSGWVHEWTAAQGGEDHWFNVFDNRGTFEIRLLSIGQRFISIFVGEPEVVLDTDGERYYILADFDEPFYTVVVPQGVTAVRVAGNGWIYGAPVGPSPVGGDVLIFLNNNQRGQLILTYNGVNFNFPDAIVFDGTCIFCQIPIPPCPGNIHCTHCCPGGPDCSACDCGECDCEYCDVDCDYCPYCGECLDCSACATFGLTHHVRPPVSSADPDGPRLDIIRIGFRDPGTVPTNVIRYQHFNIRVYVDGKPIPRELLELHWHQRDVLLRHVVIPLSLVAEIGGVCWQNVTVFVCRGCADAELTIPNPDCPVLCPGGCGECVLCGECQCIVTCPGCDYCCCECCDNECDYCDYCGECLDCGGCDCPVIVPTLHRVTFMRGGGTLNGIARDVVVANVPSGVPFNEVPIEIPVAERAGYTLVNWRVDFAGPNRTHLFLTCDELLNFAIAHGHLHALPDNSNLIIRAIWLAAPIEPPCDECDEDPCVCIPCEHCDEYPCVCIPCEICDEYPCVCCRCVNLCELCEVCQDCGECYLNLPGAVLGRCIVTLDDLIWLYAYLRGFIPVDLINFDNADMNDDGLVNWVDYYLLEGYLGFAPNNRFDISLHFEALMEMLLVL